MNSIIVHAGEILASAKNNIFLALYVRVRIHGKSARNETSFRTLAEHSDLDLRHRDDLNEMLESLPLRSEHEQWITSNAIYSAYRLIEIGNKLRLYE
jgi:hypothetical protein